MALRAIRRNGVKKTDPNDDVQDLSRVHSAAKFRPGWHKRYNHNLPIDISTIGPIENELDLYLQSRNSPTAQNSSRRAFRDGHFVADDAEEPGLAHTGPFRL
jgi:hypothetical protein